MACTWKVVGQKQIQAPTPNGSWGPMWEIRYETSDGISGTIVVTPTEHDNPEIVASKISTACGRIDRINGLSG